MGRNANQNPPPPHMVPATTRTGDHKLAYGIPHQLGHPSCCYQFFITLLFSLFSNQSPLSLFLCLSPILLLSLSLSLPLQSQLFNSLTHLPFSRHQSRESLLCVDFVVHGLWVQVNFMVHGSLLWVKFIGRGFGLISWFVGLCCGSTLWFVGGSICGSYSGFWWVFNQSYGGSASVARFWRSSCCISVKSWLSFGGVVARF